MMGFQICMLWADYDYVSRYCTLKIIEFEMVHTPMISRDLNREAVLPVWIGAYSGLGDRFDKSVHMNDIMACCHDCPSYLVMVQRLSVTLDDPQMPREVL